MDVSKIPSQKFCFFSHFQLSVGNCPIFHWILTKLITGTLGNRTTNTIRWAPRGRHVVLATVGSTSKSELEFWDLDFNSEDLGGRKDTASTTVEWGSGIQLLRTTDHYGMTDVEWDPSGRYLSTSASTWRHTVREISLRLLSN